MKNIIYEVNGKKIEVAVSDVFAHAYETLLAEEQREVWRDKKRKVLSLDALCESGFQIAAEEDIEESLFAEELGKEIKQAFGQLLPEQRDLIVRIYYCGESQAKIAEEYGITKPALHYRLERALEKLKNFWAGPLTFSVFVPE